MRIDSSTLSMDASTGHTEVKESGRGMMSLGNTNLPRPNFTLNFGPPGLITESGHFNRGSTEATAHTQTSPLPENQEQAMGDMLSDMVGGVLGTKVQARPGQDTSGFRGSEESNPEQVVGTLPGVKLGGPFSVSFASYTMEYEHQYVHVASQGAVNTEDGRNIQFSLDLRMERESFSYHSIALDTSGIFIDPLVLNFNTTLEVLAETSFSFDLNGDGKEESLSGLGEGSGFLALDLNGDKVINDGRELFGPLSGHGFQELAVHDSDENRWIDENDPIFDKLQVWMNAGTESEKLVGLREAGVGAISLANVGSLFDLKDQNNRTMAQVAASGLFLTEEGEVRSLQEIDFALPPQDDPVPTEPIATLSQAMDTLRFLLDRHRQRVQNMVRRQLVAHQERERETLHDKFWEWQEEKVKKV